ncbi:hypothetical protein H312_00272, partial [Anncaliia algerae PRA339]
KFNLLKYFKKKLHEEVVPLQKFKKQEICGIISQIHNVDNAQSRALFKKMLSSNFKSTKLSDNQLTYFSILSLDAILDIAPLYEGLNCVYMLLERTLLDFSVDLYIYPHSTRSFKCLSNLLQKTERKPIGFKYHGWPIEETSYD